MNNLINGVCVPVTRLADIVWDYGQYLKAEFSRADLLEVGDDDESNAGGDIRLQVHAGSWRTWEGDSQFDTDHRGAWGSAFVPYGCTRAQAREVAEELINDCEGGTEL
jgi:hypothetical protein